MRSAVATSSFLQLLFIIVLVSTLRLFLQLYIYSSCFMYSSAESSVDTQGGIGGGGYIRLGVQDNGPAAIDAKA